MIRKLAQAGIAFYKKHLSHRKSYRCAYGAYHGGATCSTEVLFIVREQPIWRWPGAIRSQFKACATAFSQLDEAKRRKPRRYIKNKDDRRNSCDVFDCAACFDLGRVGRGGSSCDGDCMGCDFF